jgi:hypothetical protein
VVVTGEESTHLTLELTGLSVSIAMNPGWSSAVDRRFVWVSNGRWISQPVFQICCDSKEILEPKESFSRGHTMSSHLIFPPARSTSTPLQIKKGSINPSPQTARGWDSRTFR